MCVNTHKKHIVSISSFINGALINLPRPTRVSLCVLPHRPVSIQVVPC